MDTPSELRDCGSRPNCVSSFASNPKRKEGPWELAMSADEAWPLVRQAVAETERTTIVEETENYLRAEARSRLIKFVDDLEVLVDHSTLTLSIRSASRVGYSDRGVNRRRVRALTAELATRGVLKR